MSGVHEPQNVWLFNCCQLFSDVTSDRHVQIEWVCRDDNTTCDLLARKAVLEGVVSIDIHTPELMYLFSAMRDIVN